MNRRQFFKLSPALPVAAAVTASVTLKEDGKPIGPEMELSVVNLIEGDVLVLTVPGAITQEVAERITQQVEALLPKVRAMVLGDGLDVVGVLRGPE